MPTQLASGQFPPQLIVVAIAWALLAGVGVLGYGRRLPRQGDWLAGLGLFGLLVGLALGWWSHVESGLHAATWLSGWIWPKQDSGAIDVGILRDSLGLAISTLVTLMAVILISGRRLIAPEERPERLYAAAALASAGLTLSWSSLTPWLAFVGIGLTVFAGFIAMGSRWSADREAQVAARFARERASGLILALLGACILAATGTALVWGTEPAAGGAGLEWLGAGLLIGGLLVQLQPFPLLGWVVMPSETLPAARIAFGQVFPGFAAFAVLTRMEPSLQSAGILPYLGWFALGSAALSVMSGVLKTDWKLSLGAWVSAGMAGATAALALAGPWTAIAMLISVGLASIALALLASALEVGGAASGSSRQRALWCKGGVFAAAAAGTGCIGFVSAGGAIQWIASGSAEPAGVAAFAFAVFLLALLGWRTAWIVSARKNSTTAAWSSVLLPLVLLLFALGAAWTGTLSGGAVPGGLDQVTTSLLTTLFGFRTVSDEGALGTASWIHWSVLLFAMLIAYSTTARKQDSWQQLLKAFPRVTAFFSDGYGIDGATDAGLRGVSWLGSRIEWLVGGRIWGHWLPRALDRGTGAVARTVAGLDAKLSRRLDTGVRRAVDVPAKILQLIQSGDLQWYLFFAVGSGIAILIHFLRFRG